jgi:lipopolysaccharide biosynthesis regulator YciM
MARSAAVNEIVPWFLGVLVLAAVVLTVVSLFRRRDRSLPEDHYTRGLELWLAGDLAGAARLLKRAVEGNPDAVDPYLQLGNLLRQQGDARRAAVLHRGLTVRRDIPRQMRVSITLALAEDLVALRQWREVREVLDSVEPLAQRLPRYWEARLAMWLGLGDPGAAARALGSAARQCTAAAADDFARRHAAFCLDQALLEAREGEAAQARRWLKEAGGHPEDAARALYVRGILARKGDDPDRTVALAAEGLENHPEHGALFLPLLQQTLLESGRFERTIGILQEACRTATAPPSLWIALALLYWKMDRREEALALLEGKAPEGRLTPDAAAPLLRILIKEQGSPELRQLWSTLTAPAIAQGWRCVDCGAAATQVRWFCPACHSHAGYRPAMA